MGQRSATHRNVDGLLGGLRFADPSYEPKAFTLGWSAKPKPAVEVVQKPVSTAPAVETPAAPVSASTVAQQPVERRPDPKSDNVTVLNRAGYRVERLKRFVAIDKTNGRNIAVPVSEYAIQYIGNQTY